MEHNSQTAVKMAAFEEVQETAKKQLPELQMTLSTKRGIAAGFKAAAEVAVSQMRSIQSRIDSGDIDIENGRLAINELSAVTKTLSDQGRSHELDCARLDGQIKQLEATIQQVTAMRNREVVKVERDDARDAKRSERAERALPSDPTAETTPITKAKPKGRQKT
jgi:chromosome segregation ATPase